MGRYRWWSWNGPAHIRDGRGKALCGEVLDVHACYATGLEAKCAECERIGGDMVPQTEVEQIDALRARVAELESVLATERAAREQAERRAAEAEDSARNATTTMNAAIDDYGRAITKNAHLTAEVGRLGTRVAELEADRKDVQEAFGVVTASGRNGDTAKAVMEVQRQVFERLTTERAARAQAEGRYESAAEMVEMERARADKAETECDNLRAAIQSLFDEAERAVAWHRTTGMKVAKTPAFSLGAALHIVRELRGVVGEEPK